MVREAIKEVFDNEEIKSYSGIQRKGRLVRRKTESLFEDEPISKLPSIPTLNYMEDLFVKADKAIRQLKYKKEVSGS
ncbi:hypothetical protein ACFSCX_06350 [Bacillus salitolerans]|uniref:Uncharacterized protein n=1 Tax=Bacillus salitolerans TaxID=1437434 RepID=A0ABW4LQ61_9BACI